MPTGSLKLRNKSSVSTVNNEDFIYIAKANEAQGDGKVKVSDLKEAFGISNIPGYKLVGRKIYTTSGTWTKDVGVDAIIVEVQGAGGGGNVQRSGGAGSYTKKFITSGLASTETITVGIGGAAASNGTLSSFGSHCSAGGGFANTANNGQGGSGGTASGGDENELGQPGEANPYYPSGNASPNGGKSKLGTGGIGGSSTPGGSGSRGGGGGGGSSGGAGGNGVVVVSEYTSGQEISAPIITGITGYKKIGKKVFTTSGTWIRSLGTDAINVKLVGGGGGGGGAPNGGSAAGGGSGGYAESFITSGLSSSETVTIGSGGSGGSSGGYNSGSSGGSTLFGSHLSATGGGGGSSGGLSSGGGSNGNGSVTTGIGWVSSGHPGEETATYAAGNGGPSLLGGGGKGASYSGSGGTSGNTGSNGAGGGGAWNSGSGGAGGSGLVIIEEYAIDTSGDNTIQTAPSFSASQSGSSQSISSNTLTKITLDLKQFDTNSWFDSSINYRFTPQIAGMFLIQGTVRSTVSLTTGGSLQIHKNGVLLKEKVIPSGEDSADVSATLELNGITDFIELFIISNSNAIILDATNKRTSLEGTYVGRKDPTSGSINKRIILSNNVSDSNNDIDFTEGFFQFSDLTGRAKLLPITKRLDASWGLGHNEGMLDTGSKISNTWYHCFAIYNLATGVSDILASTNLSPTLPSGFSKQKRIGSILTDSIGNIRQFFQYSNEFEWKTPVLDISTTMGTTSGSLYTIGTPFGISTKAILNCFITGAGGEDVIITNPAIDNLAPSKTAAPLAGNLVNPGGGANGPFKITTNTSSQIRARTTASGTVFRISVLGWKDYELEI